MLFCFAFFHQRAGFSATGHGRGLSRRSWRHLPPGDPPRLSGFWKPRRNLFEGEGVFAGGGDGMEQGETVQQGGKIVLCPHQLLRGMLLIVDRGVFSVSTRLGPEPARWICRAGLGGWMTARGSRVITRQTLCQIDCCCHFCFIYLPFALIALAALAYTSKHNTVTIRSTDCFSNEGRIIEK